MPSNFDYFIIFLRKKIRDGEKQIDIAKSSLVGRSAAYINKLYKGNPKSCPIDTQKKIAQYFNISYEDMIKIGKRIYFKSNPLINKKDFRQNDYQNYFDTPIPSTDELLKHLFIVAAGIKIHENVLEKLDKEECNCAIFQKKLDLYNIIFENIDEGITFFNSSEDFVFSTNRHGFLDNIRLDKNTSCEDILKALGMDFSLNGNTAIELFRGVYSDRNPISVDVKYREKDYVFRLKPVYKNEIFLGVIIVTTLKRLREVE